MKPELRDRIASRTLDLAVPVLGTATVLFLTLIFAFVPQQRHRLFPVSLLGLGVIGAQVLRRRAGPRSALASLALGTGGGIVAGMAVSGGVGAPAYQAAVVLVVLVAAFFGPRPLAWTVAGAFAAGGAFAVAELLGWIPGPLPLPILATWGFVSVLALVAAGLVYLPVSMLQEALERSEHQAEELRRARERLLEADRMESLGRLAGGVAHDFNNALSGILGSADLLRRDLAASPEAPGRQLLDLIHSAASRAADLTRGLLLYARKAPLELRPVDLNAVVRSAAALLEPALEKRAVLEVSAEASPATVRGSAGHLEHAVVNLGLNARDAISGRGRITVSTRSVELSGTETDLVPGPPARGAYVAVSVQDSGPGIDPSARSRLFEPFFTTKEAGRGTGLGLAGVLGTASAHGGALRVESEPGRGACFTMFLPARPDLAVAPPAPASSPRTGAGRVLFVDDEEVLRNLGSRVLGEAGYRVDTAADGRAAVEKVRAAPGGYGLICVDLVMPNMDGKAFCSALREIDRDVPVVVMTGYLEPGTADELLALGVRRILEKPFGPDVLTSAAAELSRA